MKKTKYITEESGDPPEDSEPQNVIKDCRTQIATPDKDPAIKVMNLCIDPKRINEWDSNFATSVFSEELTKSKDRSIEEYVDSLEQEEIRCLKMSQQFYDSLEKENQKLKKAYENMKKGLEALVDSKLCKVCMDEEACIVFIPCG